MFNKIIELELIPMVSKPKLNYDLITWENSLQAYDKIEDSFFLILVNSKEYGYISIEVKDIVINLRLWIFEVKNIATVLNEICNNILKKYSECVKISLCVLSKDFFGLRFIKKSGFTLEAIFRKDIKLNDKYYDKYYYAYFRE